MRIEIVFDFLTIVSPATVAALLYTENSTILIDLMTELDDILAKYMWQIIPLSPLFKNKHDLQWKE